MPTEKNRLENLEGPELGKTTKPSSSNKQISQHMDITYNSIMLIRHIALVGLVGGALAEVPINTQSCHHLP
jgi:hypothetical protein